MIAKCCDVVHDKKDSAIDRALAYIHIHFRDKLSIEDCAAAAGLSSGYFSRFFKAKMKISFRLYVRKVRMAEGRRLLMETDLSVMEVSFRCGIEEIRTFNRQFKEIYRCTPTQFRRSIKSGQIQ